MSSMGGQGGGSLHHLSGCSLLTSHSGTVCPTGDSSLPLADAEQQGKLGPKTSHKPVCNSPWLPGNSPSACLEIVHGGHKLSFFQVTFLSRKIWKPSSLTQLQVCYHSTYQVNDIKWGPVTGLEELFGNIWGQTGKAMQMLGFSVALSEIDSIGLEKSKIFFDLALKEKAAWEVSSGYLLGMS